MQLVYFICYDRTQLISIVVVLHSYFKTSYVCVLVNALFTFD